jgi:hypothetical protein
MDICCPLKLFSKEGNLSLLVGKGEMLRNLMEKHQLRYDNIIVFLRGTHYEVNR